MVIGGKIVSLADCMVKARIPDPKPDKPKADEYLWVAYDSSRARLPIAVAPSALTLAKMVGVSPNTVYSVWSNYLSGRRSTTKYAKVYIGDDEND